MKNVIITGANRGLGRATAEALQRSGQVHPWSASRQDGLRLDLADLESVRQFARDLPVESVDGLICNAGVQFVTQDQRTPSGMEMTFAVNHLAHFLLIQLLLPRMPPGASIWLVASGTHDPSQRTGMPAPLYAGARQLAFPLEAFSSEVGRRRYTTSKLCNVLCAYELARRLRPQGIRVNSFDPGLMPGSGLARDYSAPTRWMWNHVLPLLRHFVPNVNSVKKSGQALADNFLRVEGSGGYYEGRRPIRSSLLSYDEVVQAELWNASCELLEL